MSLLAPCKFLIKSYELRACSRFALAKTALCNLLGYTLQFFNKKMSFFIKKTMYKSMLKSAEKLQKKCRKSTEKLRSKVRLKMGCPYQITITVSLLCLLN